MRLALNQRICGFSLVEVAVVVVIVAVLAAFAVPRFQVSVERSKASEAFNYASTLHSAMERYHAREGRYADEITKLNTSMTPPEYFAVGSVIVPDSASGLPTGWEITMTRSGPSGTYGAYTVVWSHEGFDAVNSTISNEVNPFRTTDS